MFTEVTWIMMEIGDDDDEDGEGDDDKDVCDKDNDLTLIAPQSPVQFCAGRGTAPSDAREPLQPSMVMVIVMVIMVTVIMNNLF